MEAGAKGIPTGNRGRGIGWLHAFDVAEKPKDDQDLDLKRQGRNERKEGTNRRKDGNIGAEIITNIMVPYSLYNYGLWNHIPYVILV